MPASRDAEQVIAAIACPHGLIFVGREDVREAALHGSALGALKFDSPGRGDGLPFVFAGDTASRALAVRFNLLRALELDDAHFTWAVMPWARSMARANMEE